MPKMTGSRFIAETLKGYGITHVFFVPAILRPALIEMGKLGISRILVHSEKAAAYMADGYARASHRPGICMAQSVGTANLAAGLQDAFLGSSPVIALTGKRPSILKHRHIYQEIEHAPLFAPVTKFNATVESIEDLPFFLRQAFREATSGAPAPVHLDLLGNQGELVAETEAELEVLVEEQFSRYPAFRPEPSTESLRQAATAINRSKRPVIIAGGGVRASGAQPEVRELAERLSIPVATSLDGKGTIPDEHPLSVGVVGYYSRRCANRVVSEADLVIYIGSRTGSQVTANWCIPRPGTAVVQIDIDGAELGRNYPATAVLGDARATLTRLLETVKPGKPNTGWLRRAAELVSEWRREAAPLRDSEAMPIRPERICKELSDFMPPDAVLVSCTGHAGFWSGAMIDLKTPEQSYFRAAGSLGWAFPAALGVKCALPERPVFCFTGDGGFWYHIAELETAVRYGINLITVVNDNHSLNQERIGFAGEPGTDALWQFTDVNLAGVAEAIGCFSLRVTQPAELRNALEQALAARRPALIDVVSDIQAAYPRAWVG